MRGVVNMMETKPDEAPPAPVEKDLDDALDDVPSVEDPDDK